MILISFMIPIGSQLTWCKPRPLLLSGYLFSLMLGTRPPGMKTLSLNGCKIDLITYPNPCNGFSFPLVFPHILTFLLIFMNMQMRKCSCRPRTSINLSYTITGSITKCQNDSLGLKLDYLWIFNAFSAIFKFAFHTIG